MILQYNNLVQTQADRVIRVGCIYGNVTNVVVGTGVNFNHELPNNGSTLVNSTDVPRVIMRILDFYTHEEVSETQIGQELELVIEVNSQNDSFDISAGHLIAMTPNSEDSILLLDDRGCPTNLNVFPALTKISVGSVKRLVAAFQAFKFSSSPMIRFSVMLMFCRTECPQVDCGYFSNNRIKRDVLLQDLNANNGTQVKSVKKNYFDKIGKEIVKELPLELVIMVRNPKEITSDKLILGDSHRILIADYDLASQKVCIDYSVFVSFIILWVLVLVILVVTCVCIVRRYKNYYKNLCIQQRSDELNRNFGLGYSNLEKRKVHFGSPSGLEVLD
ncbi:Zona pellucida-like domain [Popillia japonica]|uniref:Zona pellucida-like domain n=1 Tax=Popillia japonica TaxID=7064 RepID=A0AAW1LV13_POPJA